MKLSTVAWQFATLNAGNISRNTFKIDTLYCVESRGLVKTDARILGTLLKQKAIYNRHKVKTELNNICMLIRVN